MATVYTDYPIGHRAVGLAPLRLPTSTNWVASGLSLSCWQVLSCCRCCVSSRPAMFQSSSPASRRPIVAPCLACHARRIRVCTRAPITDNCTQQLNEPSGHSTNTQSAVQTKGRQAQAQAARRFPLPPPSARSFQAQTAFVCPSSLCDTLWLRYASRKCVCA